ncbi:hypothetical protein A2U01_0088608, partial [Trifolium medium]|nr:hypothetical protein [Trifolium medium]
SRLIEGQDPAAAGTAAEVATAEDPNCTPTCFYVGVS